jgi:hypothetical protein
MEMRTSLYLPFEGIVINGVKGENFLLHYLLRTGPTYRIVVHESEEWLKQTESPLYGDRINIIPKKEFNRYTEISENFFLPIIEGMKYIERNGEKFPPMNLIFDLSRALFLIMMGNKYKARIYETVFMDFALNKISIIERYKEDIPEEGYERAMHLKTYLTSYKQFNESGFATNTSYDIHKDFRELLFNEEVQAISEEGYKLGLIGVNLDKTLFNIREKVTKFLHSNKLPWLSGTLYGLLCLGASDPRLATLTPTVALLSKEIQGLDLREYAPPIEIPRMHFEGSVMFQPVNQKFSFFKRAPP